MTLQLQFSVYTGHLNRGGHKGTAVAEYGQMRSYDAEIHMDSDVQFKVRSVATRANACHLFPSLKHFNVSLKVA